MSAPGLESAASGILVRSLKSGETLYATGARKLLIPASSLKVATLAAAADRLGWNYAYETRLLGAGAVEAGVLDGDLLLIGTGDPSIDDWDGAASALFRQWAERLQQLGIRSVTGGLVCDDNEFDDDALGNGWAWDDLSASYAAGVSALQFNQNTVRLAFAPGTNPGDPSHVSTVPPIHDLTVRSAVTTAPAGQATLLTPRRFPGSTTLDVHGSLPVGSQAIFRNVSVDNPSTYLGVTLREALTRNNVEISGPVVDVDALDEAPSRDDAIYLMTHRSAPLSALAETMMKNSQNLYAETLMKTLGRADGSGTFEGGRRAVRSVIGRWGIAPDTWQMADGSGLSRYNLATPEMLVSVLEHVYDDERLREPFLGALPVAGRDGTLQRRLQGTAAEGNVRAKTGSMSNVRTLAGYVWTANGEPVAFAIMFNNAPMPASADETIDAIVVALAEFSRN